MLNKFVCLGSNNLFLVHIYDISNISSCELWYCFKYVFRVEWFQITSTCYVRAVNVAIWKLLELGGKHFRRNIESTQVVLGFLVLVSFLLWLRLTISAVHKYKTICFTSFFCTQIIFPSCLSAECFHLLLHFQWPNQQLHQSTTLPPPLLTNFTPQKRFTLLLAVLTFSIQTWNAIFLTSPEHPQPRVLSLLRGRVNPKSFNAPPASSMTTGPLHVQLDIRQRTGNNLEEVLRQKRTFQSLQRAFKIQRTAFLPSQSPPSSSSFWLGDFVMSQGIRYTFSTSCAWVPAIIEIPTGITCPNCTVCMPSFAERVLHLRNT